VHAENFLVDESSNRQAVEDVAEHAPESDGVSTLALVVKAIYTIDLGALMVSAEHEEVLRVLNLVAHQQANGFNRLLSTIDVVTKEQVVGLRWEPSVLKDAKQVVVLSVHITTDLDWASS